MAYGDFLDMKQRVCRMARRDPTDATDLARAADALNDALLSLLDTGDRWDFLEAEATFSTVAGTDTYTYSTIATTTLVPTNGTPGEIDSIGDDSNGFVLRPLDWESLERASPTSQLSTQPQGQPSAFAKWGAGSGAKIRLYPEPDAIYTLRWFGRQGIAVMAADADVPVVPLAWRHRILTSFAAAQLMRMESGFAADYAASSLEAQAQQAVAGVRHARGSAKRPNEGVMSPSYGRDWPAIDATETGWVR